MSSGQRVLATVLAGFAILAGADLAWAQSMGSGGGGGFGGGGSGGGSMGSSSSGFGSSGGSSSSSFLGTSTSSFLGTTTSTTNTSTSGVGSTSFLGANYSSPTAQGIGSATSTSGTTTNTAAFGTAMFPTSVPRAVPPPAVRRWPRRAASGSSGSSAVPRFEQLLRQFGDRHVPVGLNGQFVDHPDVRHQRRHPAGADV